MFVLRVLAVLVGITIGAGIVAFLFTRDRRFLRLSWRITRYAILAALVIMALLVLERVAAIV